jgi:hypothetical protein
MVIQKILNIKTLLLNVQLNNLLVVQLKIKIGIDIGLKNNNMNLILIILFRIL